MTPEKWNRVKEIFDAAMECPPDNRGTLLDRECRDDASLRAEVERLLTHDARAGDFLEAPVMRIPSMVPEMSAPARQAFAEGELVSGRFRILRRIGMGGMGEVYQAEDLALGGEIAVKTIRPEISTDPRTLARFKREIQLSRSITHPNVCRVFDIASCQSASGVPSTYLTMEMVHGDTLAALLRKREAIGVGAALPLIRQMAEGLSAAHRAGIIHRDFKPSNVLISGGPENARRVVVTDFGLASSMEIPDTGEAHSFSRALLGTPAYMAPEQLAGEPATAATDVYAFGLVLYEMLVGKPAFRGASTFSGALSRLTKLPEPPRTICPDLPPVWERLLLRCLERDATQRFPDFTAVLAAIDQTEHAPPEKPPEPVVERTAWRKRRAWKWAGVSIAASAVLASGLAWILIRHRSHLAPPFSVDDARFFQLTNAWGAELFPSFSPDGNDLVYSGQSGAHLEIFRLKIGAKAPVKLTGNSGFDNSEPALSPDGRFIAFRSEREGGGIFLMPASGGPATLISSVGYLPAWSPDGKRIACSTSPFTLAGRGDVRSRLLIVNIKTRSQQFPHLDDNAIQPSWSPHGTRIAYWRLRGGRRDICSIPADGGAQICITDDNHLNWNPVWSPDGQDLYFASDRSGSMNLWRAPVDEVSGRRTGDFVPLTTPSSYSGYLALSHDGSRLAYAQLVYTSQLQRAFFDPQKLAIAGAPEELTKGIRVASSPDISPDGRWIAFGTGGGQEGISLIRADGADERALTVTEHRNRQPRWSPKGDLIAFGSNRGGTSEIWTMRPDGSGIRQLTAGGGASIRFCAWSPDGKLLFYDVQGDTPRIIDLDKPANRQQPFVLPSPDGPHSEFRAANWSPDGSRIVGAVFRADGGAGGLFIYSLKSGTYQRLTASGAFAVWLKDGRNLLFNDEGKLFVVDSTTYARRQILVIPGGGIDDSFSISSDQRIIYFRLTHTDADIWLLVRSADPLASKLSGH